MSLNSILPDKLKVKYQQEIQFIRRCAQTGKIKIGNHCYQQMGQRRIKTKDIYESIRNGVVMEIQSLERDTKILFQDAINTPPNFFVAVAVKPNMGLCVTAYLPDKDKWSLESDNQWRRK